jgi:hypothetical protein
MPAIFLYPVSRGTGANRRLSFRAFEERVRRIEAVGIGCDRVRSSGGERKAQVPVFLV